MDKNRISMLKDPILDSINEVQHGFFTRQGGISKGCYASLNCAYGNDEITHVEENRRRALAHLNCSLESLASVNNIHSNEVMVFEKHWQKKPRPKADAIVTNQTRIVLGSDSADCPIILLADPKGIVGLSHAGWRGAFNGIIEATVNKMVLLGANPTNITAAISPCIAKESYQVTLEFYKNFLKQDVINERFFEASTKENHYFFDLLGYIKERLKHLNLKAISSAVAIDTYTEKELFFSYRRAIHHGDSDFGGHFSCIFLK